MKFLSEYVTTVSARILSTQYLVIGSQRPLTVRQPDDAACDVPDKITDIAKNPQNLCTAISPVIHAVYFNIFYPDWQSCILFFCFFLFLGFYLGHKFFKLFLDRIDGGFKVFAGCLFFYFFDAGINSVYGCTCCGF